MYVVSVAQEKPVVVCNDDGKAVAELTTMEALRLSMELLNKAVLQLQIAGNE